MEKHIYATIPNCPICAAAMQEVPRGESTPELDALLKEHRQQTGLV